MWILKQNPLRMFPCQLSAILTFSPRIKLIHYYSVALRSQIKSKKVAHLSYISVQTKANRSQ